MARRSAAPLESFDEVLAWLDPDREKAAEIYVDLQEGLTQIFTWNHCSDPEGLMDETFSRVSQKVHQLRQDFKGDPRLFFYGVARNLMKEEAKRIKTYASLEDVEPAARIEPSEESKETTEMRAQCLDVCLQKLSAQNRELILGYYNRDKQAKIDGRHELARQLDISMATLRVRMYRLRATLQGCVERCLRSMGQ